MSLRIEDLLRAMVGKGASDLHIKAGSPPGFRIDGEVQQQEELGALSPEMTADLARQIMSPEQLERFQKEKDIDFSYAAPVAAGEEVEGKLVLVKRDGARINADLVCSRYLKN